MRWALADAGDGMDDANFETSTANAAILRLTKELTWIEECLSPASGDDGWVPTCAAHPRCLPHAKYISAALRS